MLRIRLARGGRHKAPFFRIVLTEHTKPVKSGYKVVLGWYDPLKHNIKVDVEAVREWISKGAQPTNRVAKLLFKETGDDFFKGYIVETDRKRRKKNAPEEETPEETPAPQQEAPAAEETQEEQQDQE